MSGPYDYDTIQSRWGGYVRRHWLYGEVFAAGWGDAETNADLVGDAAHMESMRETEQDTVRRKAMEEEARTLVERAFAEQEAQRFASMVRRQGGLG